MNTEIKETRNIPFMEIHVSEAQGKNYMYFKIGKLVSNVTECKGKAVDNAISEGVLFKPEKYIVIEHDNFRAMMEDNEFIRKTSYLRLENIIKAKVTRLFICEQIKNGKVYKTKLMFYSDETGEYVTKFFTSEKEFIEKGECMYDNDDLRDIFGDSLIISREIDAVKYTSLSIEERLSLYRGYIEYAKSSHSLVYTLYICNFLNTMFRRLKDDYRINTIKNAELIRKQFPEIYKLKKEKELKDSDRGWFGSTIHTENVDKRIDFMKEVIKYTNKLINEKNEKGKRI